MHCYKAACQFCKLVVTTSTETTVYTHQHKYILKGIRVRGQYAKYLVSRSVGVSITIMYHISPYDYFQNHYSKQAVHDLVLTDLKLMVRDTSEIVGIAKRSILDRLRKISPKLSHTRDQGTSGF